MSSVLKVLQINVNRNATTTENVLQLAIELNISILAIQEPWVIQGSSKEYRSTIHSSFTQVFSDNSSLRPRAMFYIVNTIRASLAPNSPKHPDCVIIDLETEFAIQIVNVYNAKHPNDPNSIPIVDSGLDHLLTYSTILLGDFNTHHPWWDPLALKSANADILKDLIENNSLNLLNTPGEGTFYRPHMSHASVLDLTLASNSLSNKIID